MDSADFCKLICVFPQNNETVTDRDTGKHAQYSQLSFTPSLSGIITCDAENTEGSAKADANVVIGDMEKEFMVWGSGDTVAEGDNVMLFCGASKYTYSSLEWTYNAKPLASNEGR